MLKVTAYSFEFSFMLDGNKIKKTRKEEFVMNLPFVHFLR